MRDIAAIWAVSDRITNFYSGGNIFYVKNGKDFTVEKVRFGLANSANDINGTGFIVVDLFEWQDLNGDGACQQDEREIIGTHSLFLDVADIPNLRNIEIPMWKVDQNGEAIEGTRVQLKDNTTYFLVAHTSPVFDGVPRYQFLTYNGFANTSFNRSLYHAATNFAFDTLKIDRRAGSLWQLSGTSGEFSEMRGRNFTIIGNSVTLFSYAVMYLEMDLVRTTSVKNDFTNNIKASTFPNPASRDLFVDLTLEKLSRNVKIDLISMDGQMIMSRNFENIQDERLKLDVSNVPGGSYTVLINTDEGAVSRKVLVIK
ncbi:MAG: T9SS type A sorting domain-containing protein [Saprospiraceae bacterium]|nr:T9SS type A sorting domain-containing protein [Saprospiraceae bacterium]